MHRTATEDESKQLRESIEHEDFNRKLYIGLVIVLVPSVFGVLRTMLPPGVSMGMRLANSSCVWRASSIFLVLSSVLLSTSTAWAQWPMQARSPGRAAASPNPGQLGTPALRFRHYLGGSVQPDGLVSHDVDDDGLAEIIYLSGGKLVCKRDDGRLVWETDPYAINRIHLIEDLDGDGTLEVLASGRPAIVAVFDIATGELRWRTEGTTFGAVLGVVRIAQLVPGGTLEVYAVDRMGGDSFSRPDAMYAFSFASGFGSGRPDADTILWQADASHRSDPTSSSDVLADVDGDGTFEVVSFDEQSTLSEGFLHIYEGPTGERRGPVSGYPMGIPLARGITRVSRVVDIESDGRQEIVVATNTDGYAPIGRNSRAIFVVAWDGERPSGQELNVRWAHQVPSIADDDHLYDAANVADIDGDGVQEVISTFVEGGSIAMHVFDGVTGALRATMADAVFQGVLVFAADGQPMVLGTASGSLRGYHLVRDELVERFFLPDRSVARRFPRDWAALSRADNEPLTMPLPDRPSRLGFLTATAETLELWDPLGADIPVASFSVEPPLEIASWAEQTDVGGTSHGLLVARSDGFLDVLDGSLRRSGSTEFMPRGLRIGGYYSGRSGLGKAPVGGPAGGPGHSVLATDGRGDLIRLEVSDATLMTPPTEVWRWPNAWRPVLIDGDDDGIYEEVVVQEGTAIAGRSTSDGVTETFTVTNVRAADDSFSGDHVPLATPAGLRFAVPIRDAAGDALMRAVDRSGIAWSSVSVRSGSSIAGYIAADDLNGDGTDDALLTLMRFRAVFGHDGSDHLFAATARYPAMPIVVGPRSSGAVTHIAAGGSEPTAITITGDATGISRTRVWAYPADWNTLRTFATLVECPETKLVGAHAESAVLGIADVASHVDGEPPAMLVLAVGQAFDDLAAVEAEGLYPGTLGNAASIADLDGTGRPAVLIGSTDGFLYAVDACAPEPSLIWSLNMRSPVGEPILLDTDGDGFDEIVVSVADGFLYGIDEEMFPAPEPVLDIVPGGPTDEDVDETRARAIAASWGSVPDALGYEWAVFTSGGTPVSRNATDPTNPFTAVEAGVTIAVYGEGLEDGAVYVFAVRALGAEGASREALSDGTRFIHTVPPDEDAGIPDAGADADADADADVEMDADESGDAGATALDGDGCGCRAAHSSRSRMWRSLLSLPYHP